MNATKQLNAEDARGNGHACREIDLVEVALTDECTHGCKIMACPVCDARTVWHQASYGCRHSLAETGESR